MTPRRIASQQCTQVPKTAPRGHFGQSVYTLAYPRLSATAQQCTQMPQNGVESPFMPICVHSCVATAARTILASRNSVHKCPKTASRGHFVQSVYTPASPPGGEGHATGAVTQPPTHTSSRSLRYLRIYIVRDRGAADSNPVVPTMNVHARG